MPRILLSLYALLGVIGIVLIQFAPGLSQSFLVLRDVGIASKPRELRSLSPDQAVGERFLSNFNNLYTIGFFISNPTQLGELVFHLKEAPDSTHPILSKRIPFSQIKPQRKPYELPLGTDLSKKGFFYYVEFNPLVDSALKEYYFYLESPGVGGAGQCQIGLAPGAHYPALRKGGLYINHQPHQPQNGHLAFITGCAWKGSLTDVWKNFWNRMKRDWGFLIFYFLLIFLVVLSLTALTFARPIQ